MGNSLKVNFNFLTVTLKYDAHTYVYMHTSIHSEAINSAWTDKTDSPGDAIVSRYF